MTKWIWPKLVNMTKKLTMMNVIFWTWPKLYYFNGHVLWLIFVGVIFRSSSNVKVRWCKNCLVIIKPKFGHIDLIKWTSLLKTFAYLPFFMRKGSMYLWTANSFLSSKYCSKYVWQYYHTHQIFFRFNPSKLFTSYSPEKKPILLLIKE